MAKMNWDRARRQVEWAKSTDHLEREEEREQEWVARDRSAQDRRQQRKARPTGSSVGRPDPGGKSSSTKNTKATRPEMTPKGIAAYWVAQQPRAKPHGAALENLIRTSQPDLTQYSWKDIRRAVQAQTPDQFVRFATAARDERRRKKAKKQSRQDSKGVGATGAPAGVIEPGPGRAASALRVPVDDDHSAVDRWKECPHNASPANCRLCRGDHHVAVVSGGGTKWHIDRNCAALVSGKQEVVDRNGLISNCRVLSRRDRELSDFRPCLRCALVKQRTRTNAAQPATKSGARAGRSGKPRHPPSTLENLKREARDRGVSIHQLMAERNHRER